MEWMIASDSSCEIRTLPDTAPGVQFALVPFKIRVGEREFVVPSYFYFDRTCCVTFKCDDFIEKACVFRCHPDFNTKPLSRLRWVFVIVCSRTTASGTDIQYDKGIVSRVFYFKNSRFLFGFRKCAEVYFAVYGFCRRFDPVAPR